MKRSGLSEILIESGVCASGSLDKLISGKHFNCALPVHKLTVEALERLLVCKFEEANNATDAPQLPREAMELFQNLTEIRAPSC